MKMMKYMTCLATAFLALVACSDADDILSAYHSDPNAVHITAEVGKASADGFTRSNPLGDADAQKKFNTDDKISVKADGQAAVTYKFNGTEWIPQDSKFLKWESETMNFTAYYPASTFNGTIDQPTEYANEASLAAADFMSYSGSQKNTGDNTLTLNMNRQMARVVVEVVGFNDQYAGATVNSINSLTIMGVKAYKHSDNKFYALMVPCVAQSTENFLSLEVGEGNTETLTGIPALEAGKSYTYDLTVGKNKVVVKDITVKDWTTDKIINGVAELDTRPYLTFKAAGEQGFRLDGYGCFPSNIEYSVGTGDWKTLNDGERISFGGSNGTLRLRGTNIWGTAYSNSAYSKIKFTKNEQLVTCTGDIRTLLDWRIYKTVDTKDARFCFLFQDCKVLTSAPDLPATTLAVNCYRGMFSGCKKLETAPALLATKLAEKCYLSMFSGCTNLKTAPALPAKELAKDCYDFMFNECTNLSSVTMLAPSAQISKNRLSYWLKGAGTSATSRTLKVIDVDAYTALVENNYLPDIWKKGTPGTTVDDIPYVTFTAEGKQKFTMIVSGGYDLSGKFEYSVNGGKWTSVVADKGVDFGGANGTLSLRGTNPSGTAESLSKYSKITFTNPSVKVACTGDIRTLLNHADYKNVATNQARFCYLFYDCKALTSAPALPAETLADDCYGYMFMNCTNLKTAPNLPAKTLASFCYYTMFSGCTSLETAPTLPAETLQTACYGYMFDDCTNLKTAPELRATTLALCCYEGMFSGCTSLVNASTLPATKLETQCYNYMFRDCTNLTSVTMLAPSAQISTNRLSYWLDGAGTTATSRTLKVKDEAAYKALENNITYLPENWKIEAEGTTVVDKNNAEINIE